MKPSGRKQVKSGARLYLPAGGLLLVVVVIMMTLNERAATAAASQAEGRPDSLALASNQKRQQQRPAHSLAAVAKRETITQRHTTTSERKLALAGQGDLSIGQSIANAKVQLTNQDMQPAAAGHYGGKGHGKYYMYAESPKKGAYKAGFKRGNHKHMIERKESQHKSHAHGYMKWHDKKGKGSHKWEYKHHKGKHY